MPPSTGSTAPVTYEASSEARKRMQEATSSGEPARLAGIASSSPPDPFESDPSEVNSRVRWVSISPGATAFTVTPRRATSTATVRVKAINPALEAA